MARERYVLLSSVTGSLFIEVFQTALHKAALNGHLDVLRFLLSNTSAEDVHAQDADGWTALHNACSKVRL